MIASPTSQKTRPVRGFLLGSLAEVLRCLEEPGPISDESVHRLRKALKRARAALRLLRDAIGEDAYHAENGMLRDAGRVFAALRDSASLIEAFDSFAAYHVESVRPQQIERTKKILRASRTQVRRALYSTPPRIEDLRRLLKAERQRAAQWADSTPTAATVAAGLRRIYCKGRGAFAAASELGTPEALHEWRKQVKYLQNALHAAYAAFPEAKQRDAAALEEGAAELGDVLGECHDLAILSRKLQGVAYAPVEPKTMQALLTLIQRDRKRHQKRAFSIGKELYRRKPKRIFTRLGLSGGGEAARRAASPSPSIAPAA